MALALLEWLGTERGQARLLVDTGTNPYYQLKVGRTVDQRGGVDWVDQVYYTSPLRRNPASANLFHTASEIVVPVQKFAQGRAYVQLFSYKDQQGKSPAFSAVLLLPAAGGILPGGGYAAPYSRQASMNSGAPSPAPAFEAPRRIPCQLAREAYSQAASYDDVLSSLLKLAGPVVASLLKGSSAPSPAGTAQAPGGKPPASGADSSSLLAILLQALLGSSAGAAPLSALGLSMSAEAYPARSPSRLLDPHLQANRFAGEPQAYSRPFVAFIDDIAELAPLLGPLMQIIPQVVGPVAQVLPGIIHEEGVAGNDTLRLVNEANHRRVELKDADNKLISNLLSDASRRLLINGLQQAGTDQAGGTLNPDQVMALLKMLQQFAPAANPTPAPAPGGNAAPPPDSASAPTAPRPPAAPQPPAPPAAPQAPVKAQSLSAAPTAIPSGRAVLNFVTAPPQTWNGAPQVLFAKNQAVSLRLRLDVAPPAPSRPLPKAIIHVCFKDCAKQVILAEKTFKQKNVPANAELRFSFSAEELMHLPANQGLTIFASLRWLSPASGLEHKALGSLEAVFVEQYYLKEQGQALSVEQELKDMQRFRPFWNKVWESPSLDSLNRQRGEDKKYLWELDASARYTILLSAEHTSNGLMETKLLADPPGPEAITVRTAGRLKAGIELSLDELNKLIPLWAGQPALDSVHLQAFKTCEFARSHACEFTARLKLKGSAANQGRVFVIPVFKLVEFTLASPDKLDENGQVLSAKEEKTYFPLPVAARLIGLKSTT